MKLYENRKCSPLFFKRLSVNTSKADNFFFGYTLIELITVIAIMAILFSIGTANLREYSRRKEVTNMALLLKGDLRLAQEYALVGRKPDTSPDNVCEQSGALLEYYLFERIPTSGPSGTGYKIGAKCTSDSDAVYFKTVDLSSKNVSISNFTNTPVAGTKRNRLYFWPRGLGVGNLTATSSVITLTKGPTSVTITVTSAGEII